MDIDPVMPKAQVERFIEPTACSASCWFLRTNNKTKCLYVKKKKFACNKGMIKSKIYGGGTRRKAPEFLCDCVPSTFFFFLSKYTCTLYLYTDR